MSVYDDLAQILSARYGKDVRQSIHDAIQQCYSDATGNPESVAAFADDILDLKSADDAFSATISAMQNTISGLQTTITTMQTTINGQFNKFFPIGSLYYTGDDTFNPNTAEGWQGTWAKIEGRFILGSSDDYEVNNVGGAATHTLSIEEIPDHNHGFNGGFTFSWGGGVLSEQVSIPNAEAISGAPTSNNLTTSQSDWNKTAATGGGQAFDIMPPYEVKHIWERIS